jgi:hypothetical protein
LLKGDSQRGDGLIAAENTDGAGAGRAADPDGEGGAQRAAGTDCAGAERAELVGHLNPLLERRRWIDVRIVRMAAELTTAGY